MLDNGVGKEIRSVNGTTVTRTWFVQGPAAGKDRQIATEIETPNGVALKTRKLSYDENGNLLREITSDPLIQMGSSPGSTNIQEREMAVERKRVVRFLVTGSRNSGAMFTNIRKIPRNQLFASTEKRSRNLQMTEGMHSRAADFGRKSQILVKISKILERSHSNGEQYVDTFKDNRLISREWINGLTEKLFVQQAERSH